MKKGKTDWIVMGGKGALCRRCGETEEIPVPMPILAFCKWTQYFIEKHRNCEEKKAAAGRTDVGMERMVQA